MYLAMNANLGRNVCDTDLASFWLPLMELWKLLENVFIVIIVEYEIFNYDLVLSNSSVCP